MSLSFSVRDIQQILTTTGYLFIVTTNVPCHLWMRITTNPPWKHPKPVLRRGTMVRLDYFFCFTAYHDNEQDEPGDTLTHTFLKEPWPVCETRWFYFHGTIGYLPSPSTSAIFEKHRGQPDFQNIFTEHFGHGPMYLPLISQVFYEGFPASEAPPSSLIAFHEKWGWSLTANHPWSLMPSHTPPEVDILAGVITLTSVEYESKGMNTEVGPPYIPLVNEDGLALYFYAYHPTATGNPAHQSTRYFLFFTTKWDSLHFELIVARGNIFATLYENIHMNRYIGGIDYGQGPWSLNLTNLFRILRRMAGLDPSPKDWVLENIRAELLNTPEIGTFTYTNDFITLFYAQ